MHQSIGIRHRNSEDFQCKLDFCKLFHAPFYFEGADISLQNLKAGEKCQQELSGIIHWIYLFYSREICTNILLEASVSNSMGKKLKNEENPESSTAITACY